MTRPATLDELLSTVEWRVDASHRVVLAADERMRFRGSVLVYVLGGSVAAQSDGTACPALLLAEGDVVFAVGGHAIELLAETPGEVIVTELRPSGGSVALELLPELVAVKQLAALDPGIALLAARMGDLSGPGDPGRAGDGVICGRMATTIISVAIRAWAEGECAPPGWLAPPADPFVTRVLDAIHENPGHPWTLDGLATVGAMSRTVFAERFRSQVGQSPASYLAQVRMDAARSYLSRDGLTVAETARMLGYESDAGFSRAFRRHTGSSPSAWRLQGDRVGVDRG